MDDLELLVDLHLDAERQGPGGAAETRKMMRLAGLDRSHSLEIADIGCGTGAASLLLAEELDAHITAVDFLPEFLAELTARANKRGVADRITTVARAMDDLPFSDGELDVIWSEGAIYNMGFEAGVTYWKRFLKPGGVLVVSEITWLGASRPDELTTHWKTEYPEIDTASNKIAALERSAYRPKAYFVLPPHCWLDNYYRPIQRRLDDFLERHKDSGAARSIAEAERAEISLYEKYSGHFGYGVYIALA